MLVFELYSPHENSKSPEIKLLDSPLNTEGRRGKKEGPSNHSPPRVVLNKNIPECFKPNRQPSLKNSTIDTQMRNNA